MDKSLLIHPGVTVAEVLEDRGITPEEFEKKTYISAAFLNKVIAGKERIDEELAFRLEWVVGVPMSFWINLQKNYDIKLKERQRGRWSNSQK